METLLGLLRKPVLSRGRSVAHLISRNKRGEATFVAWILFIKVWTDCVDDVFQGVNGCIAAPSLEIVWDVLPEIVLYADTFCQFDFFPTASTATHESGLCHC